MRTLLCLVASALVMMAAAAAGQRDPGSIAPVQEVRLYGMVAIEQRVAHGVQTLTMLSGPYASAEQCEIFRLRYTGDRVKAGDRVVTSTCGETVPSGSVFAVLLRGRPFPVVVFEDGPNLMAIGNPQMMPAQLVAICGQIRRQLGRGTCHTPASVPGKWPASAGRACAAWRPEVRDGRRWRTMMPPTRVRLLRWKRALPRILRLAGDSRGPKLGGRRRFC